MVDEYEVVWSGGVGLSGGLELDYAVMRPELGWDVIYEPPPVIADYRWLRRYNPDDPDSDGTKLEWCGQALRAELGSDLLRKLRIGPRRIALMLNAMLRGDSARLVAKSGSVRMDTALEFMSRFCRDDVRTRKRRVKLKWRKDQIVEVREVTRVWLFKGTYYRRIFDEAFLDFCFAYGVELWRAGLDVEVERAAIRDSPHRKQKDVFGVEAPNVVLNDDLVREIRWLHKRGWSYAKIARLIGVSSGTVGQIATRSTWRHVSDEDPKETSITAYAEREAILSNSQSGKGHR